jgi:hypothetical protein
MTFCAPSWSCQKSGCAIFFSREFMVSRLRATSKIAPHEFDALGKVFPLPLQIFDHHGIFRPLNSQFRSFARERVARSH